MSKTGHVTCRLGALLAALALLATLLLPRAAFASGSVVAKTTQLDEVDGKWRLQLTIDLGSVPDLNYVPMKFIFQQTALDERYCDESHATPAHQRKNLVNQATIPIDEEVGFTDSMGKALRKTKFDFSIPRNENFEAGEYTLELKKDDQTIGAKMTITLKGDNRIVDRRPMVFAGDNRPKKEDPCVQAPEQTGGSDKPASGNTSGGDKPKDDAGSGDSGSKGDKPADGTPESGQPGVEPPKQGGCRCELAGFSGEGAPLAASAALALAAMFGARRRRRGSRAA